MRKNSSCDFSLNVSGNNNTIIINEQSTNKQTKKLKSNKNNFLNALSKLIHSAIVNISVLLIEIFTRLR